MNQRMNGIVIIDKEIYLNNTFLWITIELIAPKFSLINS